MIYLDNAATGGFKPRAVTDAVENVIRYLSANPGRSAHRLSITGANIIYNARSYASKLFNCNPDRVIFTKNCTEALNQIIFGSLKVGGHVITTIYEHNSILRPLSVLQQQGLITLDIVCPTKEKTIVQAIKEKINSHTYLVICTAQSNVTGEKLPLKEIGLLCKNNGLLFAVDGAQAGGHISLDVKQNNINFLALAGHKGLYGIMGTGLLIIDQDSDLSPLIMGGTGSESFNLSQPKDYPERLESGTVNLPGIASLKEGLKYVNTNINSFGKILLDYTKTLKDELQKIDGIKIYSCPNEAGIVSFLSLDVAPEVMADILNSEYDVAVRAGLHCAPLIHKHLNTDKTGLVRASLSVQNSVREIAVFVRAVREICAVKFS